MSQHEVTGVVVSTGAVVTGIGKCSLCGDVYVDYGNDPWPIGSGEDRCCDDCYETRVEQARVPSICAVVCETLHAEDYEALVDFEDELERDELELALNTLGRLLNSVAESRTRFDGVGDLCAWLRRISRQPRGTAA